MRKISPRIPEGKAIEDTAEMTMEEYSETMKKQLGKEYVRFAHNVNKITCPDDNARVLEIGPGPGWAGISLLKLRNDLKLDGLEPSTDMIRVAEKNAISEGLNERINYIEGEGELMTGIPDKHYDLVISRDSLHHWENPHKVFRQIRRVLQDKGKLYIHDHRRDIGLFGRMIVTVIGALVAGKMARYWKSSIAASYTKEEIDEIIQKVDPEGWISETGLMDLIITSLPGKHDGRGVK